MIRRFLARRGYLLVPLPPDALDLREAGRATRRETREWINSVAETTLRANTTPWATRRKIERDTVFSIAMALVGILVVIAIGPLAAGVFP